MNHATLFTGLALLFVIVSGCSNVVEEVHPSHVRGDIEVTYVIAEDTTVSIVPTVYLAYQYPLVNPEPNGFLWFHGSTEIRYVPGDLSLLEDAEVGLNGHALLYDKTETKTERVLFADDPSTHPLFQFGELLEIEVNVASYDVNLPEPAILPQFEMIRIPAPGTVRSPGQSIMVYRFKPDWYYHFYLDYHYPSYGWVRSGNGRHNPLSDGEDHEWWFDIPTWSTADSVRLDVTQFCGIVHANFTRTWVIVQPDTLH